MWYKINVKSTSTYANTQRDHKPQRLMTQRETVTQRCNTDRIIFFFFSYYFFFLDWGYMFGHQNHKDYLAKPSWSDPHENYPVVAKFKLKI